MWLDKLCVGKSRPARAVHFCYRPLKAVCASILRQTFPSLSSSALSKPLKCLTTLPMGGGKRWQRFRSEREKRRRSDAFRRALMTELYRHLGPGYRRPPGISARAGARALCRGMRFPITAPAFHRQRAFLRRQPDSPGGDGLWPSTSPKRCLNVMVSAKGMRVAVSGSGNVAQYAIEKAIPFGARVVTSVGFAERDAGR